jgi:hypothetical protein
LPSFLLATRSIIGLNTGKWTLPLLGEWAYVANSLSSLFYSVANEAERGRLAFF